MKNRLLTIIVCPLCYKKLTINLEETGLICNVDHIIFPIIQGIPVLLKEKSRKFLENKNYN